MGKKKSTKGDQLDLIDTAPENKKQIISVAKLYKKAQAIRIDALAQEKKHKHTLLDLIEKAKLVPLPDGTVKFRCDGLKFIVTPRDKLVQIKECED